MGGLAPVWWLGCTRLSWGLGAWFGGAAFGRASCGYPRGAEPSRERMDEGSYRRKGGAGDQDIPVVLTHPTWVESLAYVAPS